MEVSELIKLDSNKVRRDSNLMAFYIEAFKLKFGYAPNCAGCTFNSDWKKLINAFNNAEKGVILSSNKLDMDKNFKLKKIQHKIFAYHYMGKTYRLYDKNFTNEFVENFLKFGTQEEISERKKLFSVLPSEKNIQNDAEVKEATILNDEDAKEIIVSEKIEEPKKRGRKTKK